MIIKLIKKQKGHEVAKDYEKKYGSIKELERLYKESANNLFLVDLENWKYLKKKSRRRDRKRRNKSNKQTNINRIRVTNTRFY